MIELDLSNNKENDLISSWLFNDLLMNIELNLMANNDAISLE